MSRILILGGYGKTGEEIAKLLLQESQVEVIIAGRNLAKATDCVNRLGRQYGSERLKTCEVDAGRRDSLRTAFKDVDFVVVASSTTLYAREVIDAALEAGADYLDVQISLEKVEYLRAKANEIIAAGRCFITEAGYHPGLPTALVRFLASDFDKIKRALVYSAVNIGTSLPESPSTMDEFVGEFLHYRTEVFKGGHWQTLPLSSMKSMVKIDFGPKFGTLYSAPMMLEELRILPELYPELEETGFYIADTNTFVSMVIFPVMMIGLKAFGKQAVKPLGKLLYHSYRLTTRPPYGVIMKAVVEGECNGKPRTEELWLTNENGYIFTALPVVAGLLQYLDGSSRKPGLWMLGQLIEPQRFIMDLKRLGGEVGLVNRSGFVTESGY